LLKVLELILGFCLTGFASLGRYILLE